MALDYASAKQIIRLAASMPIKGEVLMLGRQAIQVRPKHAAALDGILAGAGYDFTFADLLQEDGFSETLFLKLGFPSVLSMDLSDYEGADILHDLNDPVPDHLYGRFGIVFDGGTTEHVFDVATTMANVDRMLAPGGIFVSCAPGNNWFTHGFYQFSPELVYGYWKHGCGYDVCSCLMLPEMPRDKAREIPDPAGLNHDAVAGTVVPNQRVYLYYEVQKGPWAHPYRRALQTDYVARWSQHDVAQGRYDSPIVARRHEHEARS
ncbi:class I SAM-dependent methyltransferase [Chachezhania sediminis]|uniref:hypothetical protein n=1 Tax=Chachezhania sediminis TaxID=2599291 RepID=UPI00131BD010|nr:hypothetical protein [Chachezhania sediminis]